MYEDIQEAIRAFYEAIYNTLEIIKTEPILKYPLIFIITGQIISLPLKIMKKAMYIENCRMHKEPEKKTWKYE